MKSIKHAPNELAHTNTSSRRRESVEADVVSRMKAMPNQNQKFTTTNIGDGGGGGERMNECRRDTCGLCGLAVLNEGTNQATGEESSIVAGCRQR